MIIGIPKEIKTHEYRVAITPSGVEELTHDGNQVLIEQAAGMGSGFTDQDYSDAGAEIVDKVLLFTRSDLIVKVKEPLPPEFDLLREGQAIFSYLHLAPNPGLMKLLLAKRISGLAYETLEESSTLPLLAPMSEIAGRMAPIVGSYFLQRPFGGRGVIPSGAVGVRPAKMLILGAGTVGAYAARIAIGLGMETCVLNRGAARLARLDEMFPGRVVTLPLTSRTVRDGIRDADIVIGAVLVPGAKTPVFITKDMLSTMQRGSVIVDVSVDQGGCAETSRATTHDYPIYELEGIIHYAVANMPGAYPRSSTLALTNATLPYIRRIAQRGIDNAIAQDTVIRTALNTYRGEIAHTALTELVGR